MYLVEQYRMYKTANSLVENDDFGVLFIKENHKEIWLEKYKNKTSHVVRLVHSEIHWKNHLKQDIAAVFQKAKTMKRYFLGKHVEIHNVYISSHAPVDDWEVLKKPMQLKERNPIKMKVYYLSDEDLEEEQSRLQQAIGSSNINYPNELSEQEMEEKVNYTIAKMESIFENKTKEMENVFSKGKPLLTYFLLAINIIMFFILEISGDSKSTGTLIQFGAKYNPAIIENDEWWRIISSMFLHIGFVHLFMNMLAVYYLGVAVERIYGNVRFIIIYFLAGIGGGLASFAFTTNISAGASGALFGLFGALLFFGLIHKRVFFQTMGPSLLIIIGINLIFGFVVPQVDNGAHLGGLVTGFIASAILHLPGKRKFGLQFPAFIVYAGIIFGLITFGIENNMNSTSYQLMKSELLNGQEEYEEAVETATEGLKDPGDFESHLLFQRSYAYIRLGKIDQAVNDLRKTIQINNEFAEAHFNLAILYYNNGELNKAKERIKKAYELKPEGKDVQQLYEEITGDTVD
ncbi:rhomboid family intramembrane serine protease [Virgibacillus doumboii]|uniref:rhomboid family intramembrane serine protease n=1 Tax=Virgibacillus doumboii TaxID=2697503 RepID=UPI0013DF2560|nr:rhomboid family intramembrane serine protease [Virgibacillus doumboii]